MWENTDNDADIRKIKIVVSILCLTFFIYNSSVNHFIPTDYARNTFFYADFFVADHIVQNGHIPTTGSVSVPDYWGKINSKLLLPLMPMLLSLLKMVAGLPYSTTYTFFPSWLLITAGFYILLRGMRIQYYTRSLISIAAGFAVPATPRYPIEIYAVVTGIMCLSIATLFLHLRGSGRSTPIGKDNYPTLLIMVLFSIFIFYWDPEKFFIFYGIVISSWILLYSRKKSMAFALSTVVVLSLIFIQSFELPPYVAQLETSITAFADLDASNPVAEYLASSNNPTADSQISFDRPHGTTQERGYYSLLPLPILLPLSALGGIYSLIDIKRRKGFVSFIGVSWGIVAIALSTVFIFASEGWLAGRSFTFALPVMIFGCARFLRTRRKTVRIVVSTILSALFVLSVILALTTSSIQLHTYEPGISEGSKWASEHANSAIVTDHKLGAPMAASGDFRAIYPKDNETLGVKTFYPYNYSEFSNKNRDHYLFSDGMTEYGIRAAGDIGPISKNTYNIITDRSDLVYSNGKSTIVVSN